MENQVIFVWRELSVSGLVLVTQNASTRSPRSPLRVSLLWPIVLHQLYSHVSTSTVRFLQVAIIQLCQVKG